MRRWLTIVGAIVFMAGALAVEFWWLPPPGYPQRYGYTGDQYQTIDALFVQLIVSGWRWFRAWFDRDTITTIAIAATAIFTGTLWRATNRLWRTSIRHAEHMERSVQAAEKAANAAIRNADALPALERAYLFLIIDQSAIRRMQRIPHLNEPSEQTISELRNIEYEFVNEGKTPAIIRRISTRFEHLTELPKALVYRDSFYGGEQVVRAGGTYPPPANWGALAHVLRNPDTTLSMRFQGSNDSRFRSALTLLRVSKPAKVSFGFTGALSMTMFSGESTKQLSAGAITDSPMSSKDMAAHSTTIEHSARTARLSTYIGPSRGNR